MDDRRTSPPKRAELSYLMTTDARGVARLRMAEFVLAEEADKLSAALKEIRSTLSEESLKRYGMEYCTDKARAFARAALAGYKGEAIHEPDP